MDGVATPIQREADPARVQRFEADLETAWRAVLATDDPRPLVDLIEAWWAEAAMWALNPEGIRRANASMAANADELPEHIKRRLRENGGGMTRERATAMWEEANGRPLR